MSDVITYSSLSQKAKISYLIKLFKQANKLLNMISARNANLVSLLARVIPSTNLSLNSMLRRTKPTKRGQLQPSGQSRNINTCDKRSNNGAKSLRTPVLNLA